MLKSGAAPRVSVIVPVFNGARYLDRCLAGLLGQQLDSDDFEIIMVDNNSTDGSQAVIRRHPTVQLLHEPKQGAYAARNCGLACARGRLIAFTDPDCVPAADWLATLTAPLAEPGILAVKGRTVPSAGSRALLFLSAYEHHRDLYVFGSSDPTLYHGQTNNMAVRREVIDAHGGFVELARGADTIFARRLVDQHNCRAMRYEPRATVSHLEVQSVRDHFEKARIYRVSRAHFDRIAEKRSPRIRERLRIFADAMRAGDISWAAALPTAVLLLAGEGYARAPIGHRAGAKSAGSQV